MTNAQVILTIAVIAIITAALRGGPFLIFNGKKETPRVITYLGKALPSAIMGMLVVYCMKDVQISQLASVAPVVIASLAVIVLHLWKRNTLVSITVGTILYMILVQVVF